jgi:ankyrin repeat protein
MSGSDFSTPLHIASQKGWFMVVQVLIKHHADVDPGGQRYTPLHFASLYGYPKVARPLFEHGADANRKADPGDTPLRFLSDADRNLEVAKLLLDLAQIRMLGPSRVGTRFMRHSRGATVVSSLLLKHGADTNVRGAMKWGTVQVWGKSTWPYSHVSGSRFVPLHQCYFRRLPLSD